jgi:hypothetical protein
LSVECERGAVCGAVLALQHRVVPGANDGADVDNHQDHDEHGIRVVHCDDEQLVGAVVDRVVDAVDVFVGGFVVD